MWSCVATLLRIGSQHHEEKENSHGQALTPHGALSLSPTGLKPVQDYFPFLLI